MAEKKDTKLNKDIQVIKDFIPKLIDFIKKHKKALIIAASIAVVLGSIISYELIEYTSTPGFCNLFCHEMTPEVKSWEKSSHAKKDVECKDCHYGKGIWGVVKAKWLAQWQLWHHITGAYSNHPLSEAKKHGFELAEQNIHKKGQKVYYIKSHGYAIDVINYNCERCHPRAFEIERSSGRSVRMAHKQHIERGIECSDCHINIVHGVDPKGKNLPTMWTCFRCHNDEKAPREDCALCHVGQKEMWEGIAAKEVLEEPALMLDDVECSDCHLKEDDYLPPKGGTVCTDCHDDDEAYAIMLKNWQRDVKKKSFTLSTILDELEQRMKDIKEAGKEVPDFEVAKSLFENAKYNATMIEHDGSKGAHNYEYAISILNASLGMAREARNILAAAEYL
jgi:nitrate/TMAO reductase-like tetraheme cytochrome c subunit